MDAAVSLRNPRFKIVHSSVDKYKLLHFINDLTITVTGLNKKYYLCKLCSYSNIFKNHFVLHLKYCHSDLMPFRCSKCNFGVIKKHYIHDHIQFSLCKSKQKLKLYKCTINKKLSKYNNNFIKNLVLISEMLKSSNYNDLVINKNILKIFDKCEIKQNLRKINFNSSCNNIAGQLTDNKKYIKNCNLQFHSYCEQNIDMEFSQSRILKEETNDNNNYIKSVNDVCDSGSLMQNIESDENGDAEDMLIIDENFEIESVDINDNNVSIEDLGISSESLINRNFESNSEVGNIEINMKTEDNRDLGISNKSQKSKNKTEKMLNNPWSENEEMNADNKHMMTLESYSDIENVKINSRIQDIEINFKNDNRNSVMNSGGKTDIEIETESIQDMDISGEIENKQKFSRNPESNSFEDGNMENFNRVSMDCLNRDHKMENLEVSYRNKNLKPKNKTYFENNDCTYSQGLSSFNNDSNVLNLENFEVQSKENYGVNGNYIEFSGLGSDSENPLNLNSYSSSEHSYHNSPVKNIKDYINFITKVKKTKFTYLENAVLQDRLVRVRKKSELLRLGKLIENNLKAKKIKNSRRPYNKINSILNNIKKPCNKTNGKIHQSVKNRIKEHNNVHVFKSEGHTSEKSMPSLDDWEHRNHLHSDKDCPRDIQIVLKDCSNINFCFNLTDNSSVDLLTGMSHDHSVNLNFKIAENKIENAPNCEEFRRPSYQGSGKVINFSIKDTKFQKIEKANQINEVSEEKKTSGQSKNKSKKIKNPVQRKKDSKIIKNLSGCLKKEMNEVKEKFRKSKKEPKKLKKSTQVKEEFSKVKNISNERNNILHENGRNPDCFYDQVLPSSSFPSDQFHVNQTTRKLRSYSRKLDQFNRKHLMENDLFLTDSSDDEYNSEETPINLLETDLYFSDSSNSEVQVVERTKNKKTSKSKKSSKFDCVLMDCDVKKKILFCDVSCQTESMDDNFFKSDQFLFVNMCSQTILPEINNAYKYSYRAQSENYDNVAQTCIHYTDFDSTRQYLRSSNYSNMSLAGQFLSKMTKEKEFKCFVCKFACNALYLMMAHWCCFHKKITIKSNVPEKYIKEYLTYQKRKLVKFDKVYVESEKTFEVDQLKTKESCSYSQINSAAKLHILLDRDEKGSVRVTKKKAVIATKSQTQKVKPSDKGKKLPSYNTRASAKARMKALKKNKKRAAINVNKSAAQDIESEAEAKVLTNEKQFIPVAKKLMPFSKNAIELTGVLKPCAQNDVHSGEVNKLCTQNSQNSEGLVKSSAQNYVHSEEVYELSAQNGNHSVEFVTSSPQNYVHSGEVNKLCALNSQNSVGFVISSPQNYVHSGEVNVSSVHNLFPERVNELCAQNNVFRGEVSEPSAHYELFSAGVSTTSTQNDSSSTLVNERHTKNNITSAIVKTMFSQKRMSLVRTNEFTNNEHVLDKRNAAKVVRLSPKNKMFSKVVKFQKKCS